MKNVMITIVLLFVALLTGCVSSSREETQETVTTVVVPKADIIVSFVPAKDNPFAAQAFKAKISCGELSFDIEAVAMFDFKEQVKKAIKTCNESYAVEQCKIDATVFPGENVIAFVTTELQLQKMKSVSTLK